MALASGAQLGPYEIVERIGAGGMGEVYRARDTTLDRDVAVKVLPDAVAEDRERLARFEREAKLLASLNHPNIASIYGLERSGKTLALVMELIDGPTIAARIREGPIPIDEALPLAAQITEALAAAHAQGIIHRDLKPANVKVTPDGTVKVLDFGLAKALHDETPGADVSQSPTLTKGTAIGVILGTASYMSPEQAKGKAVDKRTDIWAFGCVVYEMLTGKKAFPGEDASEALAAVIRAEPDFDALPRATPSSIRRVLRRGLTKNATDRLADIADARLELADAETNDDRPAFAPAVWQQPRWILLAAVLLVTFTALALRNFTTVPPTEMSPTRYVVSLPERDILNIHSGGLAVSPDGRRLAYVGTRDGRKQLFLRERGSVEARLLPGTEDAATPFFSPDGEWLAFFNGRSLLKVSMSGGAPQPISDAGFVFGATWGPDDIILVGGRRNRLESVPASGGIAVTLDAPPTRFPQFLPGGRSVLANNPGATEVFVHDLESGERHEVIGGAEPRLIGDYLIVGREGSLWAAPFDTSRAHVTAPAVPVLEGIQALSMRGATYGVADDGSLTFVPRTREAFMTILDPRGGRRELAPLLAHSIRLSPDGERVAGDELTFTSQIWVYELGTGSRLQVASGCCPAWSADGSTLAYSTQVSERAFRMDIAIKASDGTGEERVLVEDNGVNWPASWSPDGEWLAVDRQDVADPNSSIDIWMVALSGDSKEFVATSANEGQAAFSPDGRWVADRSDQSGRFEIYVKPFPGPGERVIASVRGGESPVWSADGTELYFRQDTAVMAVDVDVTDGFAVSTPRLVVDGHYWLDPTGHVAFGVFPDGKLLMIDTGQANEIHVVLNWVEELKRLVPADE